MKNLLNSKWFKYPFYFIVIVFSLIGMFLTITYTAMQFGFTKEAGKIDQNDRIFNEIKDKYNQSFKKDTSSFAKKDFDIYQRIIILNRYYPKNAVYIMNAAIFIKQVKMQWERPGFPIDNRHEILATLFNVGYPQSVPKSNPRVGGSGIMIYEKEHSFGSISYEFYYSGELFELFPFISKRFDWYEKA